MTQVGFAELLSDYDDFGRPQALREALRRQPRLFVSPERRHLLLWLSCERRLLSFVHLPAASSPPQAGDYLEHAWPALSSPLCGLVFLQSPGQPWYVSLVWESGRAEVWSPPLGPSSDRSWSLLQCVDLCHGPRARVASVCCSEGRDLVWCEERTTSNLYTYCLCRRSLGVSGRQVTMGTKTIVLHHSPLCSLVSSPGGRHVFVIPSGHHHHPVLIYAPGEASVTVSTLASGVVHTKTLAEGDADYKKLSLDYIGVTANKDGSQVAYFGSANAGRLPVMTANGQIHLLHPDGTARHVVDLDISSLTDAQVEMAVYGDAQVQMAGYSDTEVKMAGYGDTEVKMAGYGDTRVQMAVYNETLLCAIDSTLHLVDLRTGRLLAKQLLNAGRLLLVDVQEAAGDVQLLTEGGVYQISRRVGAGSAAESARLDMVYEEACKYYQRRSLSGTKLTAQSLKENGMFQAPIALSAILGQKNGSPKGVNADLLANIGNELQCFLSLELLKSCIVNAPGAKVAKYCDELVDLELTRLLQTDLDRDGLAYINSLFDTFPKSSWKSISSSFQFQQNGDGKMVVRATAELWKKVLSPVPLASGDGAQNGVYPLFEVMCQSLCAHKPKWLPAFVQHAQECSGALHRNFTTKERGEGAPLYKRALAVLNKRKENTNVDLEVEILLHSGRPQAVIQAIHTLIRLQRWPRVMEETLRHARLNPLIKKDVFITLLVEFVKHRQLDPYAPQLCEICPDGMTATDILRIVLLNLPKTPSDLPPAPFADNRGAHLTIGLLRPLLNKVLQKQSRREDKSANSTFSPTTPPQRTNKPAGQGPAVNGEELSPTDFYATKAL